MTSIDSSKVGSTGQGQI